MKRNKWMKVFVLAVIGVGLSFPALSQDVRMKYTGPSGQGDLEWINTADGSTLMKLTRTSLVISNAVTATSFDGALDATDLTGDIAEARITNAMTTAAVPAANLTGDIAADRMTVNGVVATDFTQDSGILVGTGSGTFAEETGNTLRTSLGLAIGTDVLAPNGDGTSLTGVALDTEVWGASDITIGDIASGQLITTNAIAMLDIGGTAKSDYALVRVWVSEAAYGAASTNNIEALTLSGGTAVATETANADYWYVTSSGGEATATITGTAAGSNYINVSVGANVTSEVITLIP